jgi:glyoxylase-like metal-dependent hydrolase (beta-lactamase superfamily II)
MHRHTRSSLLVACALVSMTSANPASAQAFGRESALIDRVAEAMGGAAAILDVHTLEAQGYGMEAYFWGGGNASGDPEAVQKWAENPEMSSVWDFDRGRYRTRYRHNFLFPFGGSFGHSFAMSAWGVDGGLAYTSGPNGTAQRLPDWTTGGAAVRSALTGNARAANYRVEDGYELVDLSTEDGSVTLGIDPATMLPRFVRWAAPHQNLGRVVITTSFAGYQNWDGLLLPLTWSSRIDWRDTLIQTRMLDAYHINSDQAPDIAAPAALAESPPARAAAAVPIAATKVADGIWHLNPGGNTLIEFDDHLVVFELGGNADHSRAVIDLANDLVPGKRLTHVIVSHHHFDHTSGFRAAVEAGLTVISHRGNERVLEEIAARPAAEFADIVPLPNGGRFDFVPVDEHLRLQDRRMTLDIYAVVKHNHMANAVFAYAPESRTFIEADLATPANQFSFWAEAYEDNITHYGLEVAMVSPNHVAQPMTHQETLDWIRQGVPAALARCRDYDALGRNLPGCPPYIYRDWNGRPR